MDTKTKIIKERIRLLMYQPFFGHLAIGLSLVECPEGVDSYGDKMETMAVDGRRMFYYPPFVEKLSPDELRGIIMHEILHCALGHLWRVGSRDHEKFNWATDYVVNQLVVDNSGTLPQGCLLNQQFKDMSAEQVYHLLPDPPKGGGGSGQGTVDSHSPWGKGDKGGGDGKDKKDGQGQGQGAPEDPIEAQWKRMVAEAATHARMQGKLPSNIEGLIEEVLEPTLPWYQILRSFVQQCARKDYRLCPPNKRHIWRGIYLPSLQGDSLEIGVAIDTSGSISDECLKTFVSEVRGITSEFDSHTIHLYACDAAVHEYYCLEEYDEWPTKYSGRGGTDFRPVFEDIGKRKLPISCLVFLTDMMGTFPEEAPEYPVIWIATTDIDAPFGDCVKLDLDE